MADEAQQTEVGKWLLVNGAKDYAQKFYDQGYTDKADLLLMTDDAVKEIVADKRGLASKLLRLIAAERKAGAPKDPKTPPPVPPDLPKGTTLDLSGDTPQTPDGVAFKLPEEILGGGGNSEVISPFTLKLGDWLLIAKNSGLLRGFTMEDFGEDSTKAPQAKKPVLDWMVPKTVGWMSPLHLSSQTNESLTYSQQTAQYVRVGFDSQSASGGYAGCSASFEREHKEREAHSSLDKTLYMVGIRYFPRAQLNLDECTQVSPKFIADLTAAVGSQMPVKAMQQIFDDYGVAVPTQVEVGGQMYFVHEQKVHAEVNEKEVRDTIKAAMKARVGGAEGSASTSFETGTSEKVSAQSLKDAVELRVLGGRTTDNNPKTWPDTVNNPKYWTAIKNIGLRSVLDLPGLPADLRDKAMAIWNKMPPLIGGGRALVTQGQNFRQPTPGFLMASSHVIGDSRGGMMLACSTDDNPTPGDPGVVWGGGSTHWWWDGNMFFDQNSVCLPIPAGYFCGTSLFGGSISTRFSFIPTKLSFGQWQPASTELPNRANMDGFLFVTLRANSNDDRLVATCLFENTEMAGVGVHLGDHQLPEASFCLAVPKGTTYRFNRHYVYGNPNLSAWFLPVTSPGVRLEPPHRRNADEDYVAYEDGILSALLVAGGDLAAGHVELWSGSEGAMGLGASACFEFSTSSWGERLIARGSAMLPVRKGQHYRANRIATARANGPFEAQVWWTPIVSS